MFKASLRVLLHIGFCCLSLCAFSQSGYKPALIWEKQYPANSSALGSASIGTSVLQAANGDYLVNYSASLKAGFILRLGSDGTVLNESFRDGFLAGSFSQQYGYKHQVSLNSDTAILFGGYGLPLLNPAGGTIASILKKKTYNTLNANQEGYTEIPNSDAAVSVASLPNGEYAVLYRTLNTAASTPNWELNVARYSSSDQQIFDTPLNSAANEYGTAIVLGADGYLYVTGFTDLTAAEPGGVFDGNSGPLPGTFVIKLDLNGVVQWVKTFSEEHSIDMVSTSSSFLYVLTRETSKISLRKLTPAGALVWQKLLINSNSRNMTVDSLSLGITALSDDNLLFHYRLNPQNAGDSTYTVIEKLDGNDASVQWTKNVGTLNWSTTYQLIEVANNQLLGVGGVRLSGGEVTDDPITYSDMRTWVYQLGSHIEGIVTCAGQIDTALAVSGPTTVCDGGSVTLTVATGFSYQWFKDGVFINNQATNQLVVTSSGNYQAILSNTTGCLDSTRIVPVTISAAIDTAVSLSGSATVCAGQTVTLQAAPGLSYQWYKDGSAIISSTSQQYIATTSGIYKVILSTPEGCKDTSRNIVVSVGAAIDTSLAVSGATSFCAGGSVQLTAASNLNYAWEKDGAVIANQTGNQLTVTSSGVYHAILTATGGCSDTTRDVTVDVGAVIDTAVTVNGSSTLCAGGTVVMSAAAGLQYQWLKNGTAIAAASSRVYGATTSGNYAVVLSNGQGCSDTSRSITVTIGQPIDTTLTVTGATTFCAGQSATLTAAANLGYSWYRNGTLIANQSNNTLQVTTSGTYHAILTAGGGCTDTTRDVVFTVGAAIDTTVTVAGSPTLCSGGTVVMTAAAGLQYQWLKNGAAINAATGNTYGATASGTYAVILSNAQGCRDTSRSIIVSIGQPIDTTLTVTGATTFCAGQSATLTAAANLGYSWYRNGTLIANQSNNTLQVTTSGTYHAILTAGGGCTDTTRDVVFTVGAAIDTTVTVAGSPTLCSGGTVVMTAAAGLQYQWLKNGAAINAAIGNTYGATASGTYAVILSNAQGCRDTSRSIIVSIGQPIDTTLTVTGATTFCAGQAATLTAAPNLGYSWYRNGTLIANQSSNTLQVTTSGTYHAILTAGGGCTDTTRDVVFTVGAAIDTTVTVAGSPTLCSGGTVVMTAAAGLQYQWLKNGAAINAATGNTYGATASGTYAVILSNAQGCRDTSRSIIVSIGQPIDTTLIVTGATTFCAGQSATLTAAANLGYSWYRNGTLIANQSSNTLQVTTSGTYHAILTAGGGCTDTTRDVVFTVGAAIDTTVTVAGSPTLCSGGTVVMTAAAGLQYQWLKNGTAINAATGNTYGATASGTYAVILSNGQGCLDTSRAIVISIGQALDTTLTVTGSTALCGGQSATLTAAPNLSYRWYRNGTLIANQSNNTLQVTVAGTYHAILTAGGGCSDTTRDVTFTVAAAIDTTLTINGSPVICNQDVVQLTAAPGLNYQWYRNGTLQAGATGQSLSVTTPGNYRAVLANGGGCIDSTRSVTISNSNVDTSVSLSGSPIVCAGQTVTLTAAAGLTYQWYKDGQTIAGATNRIYTATTTGNYQALLTTAQGCNDSSRVIPITISNTITGSITPATASICSGSPVDLTATGGSLYQWYKDGVLITNATASVYRATTPGVYSVVITNAGGCSGPAQNMVNVQQTVLDTSINVTGPAVICQGGTVTLTAGTATSYQWLLNGSAIAGATAKQYNANQSGSYSVIVGNASGCSDTTRSVTVTVSGGPVAAIATPTTTVICGTTPIVLTASGGPSYTWLKNNVAIAGATAATYGATTSGSYSVIVTNAGGCSDTSNVVVLSDFAKPVAGFNAAAACVGGETVFTNTSTTAGNATATYKWTFGDNTTSTDKDPKHVFATAGTYDVKLVVSVTGCQQTSDSITKQVVIGSSATGTRYPTVNTTPGAQVTLTARNGGTAYSWNPVNGLSSPTSQVTTATLISSQEYTVQIAQAAGCNVIDTVLVNVQASTGQTQVFVPTGFTPNSNGRNDVLRPMLINMRSITYFRVFNRWGKLVYQTSSIGSGWDGRVNGAPQPRETYSWTFEGVDNTGKVIKSNGKTVLIR